MFLPYDLRDWGPAGHIVHFILEAVEQIPTPHFQVNERGSGSEQYPPTMMLGLLIYCYATGRVGSRTIEAASYSDVAVRYLCANHHPDHASICAFRTANEKAFQAAFVTVQQLAGQLRVTKVGTISLDGTKIQANASKHAAVNERHPRRVNALPLSCTRREHLRRDETRHQRGEPVEALALPLHSVHRDRHSSSTQPVREAKQIHRLGHERLDPIVGSAPILKCQNAVISFAAIVASKFDENRP